MFVNSLPAEWALAHYCLDLSQICETSWVVPVVIRLLSRRFGHLSPETMTRLDNANQQQLEAWADRILDARTLDEVFLE